MQQYNAGVYHSKRGDLAGLLQESQRMESQPDDADDYAFLDRLWLAIIAEAGVIRAAKAGKLTIIDERSMVLNESDVNAFLQPRIKRCLALCDQALSAVVTSLYFSDYDLTPIYRIQA